MSVHSMDKGTWAKLSKDRKETAGLIATVGI